MHKDIKGEDGLLGGADLCSHSGYKATDRPDKP